MQRALVFEVGLGPEKIGLSSSNFNQSNTKKFNIGQILSINLSSLIKLIRILSLGSTGHRVEVERAQFFRARAQASSVEPEPVKIALDPASSPSILLIKMLKFEFEPTTSLLEK